MATQLADIATLDQAGGPSVIEQGRKDARVKVNTDSYTLTTATTSGSTIDIGALLPNKARVLEIVLNFSVAQTSLTLSVGDDASATRYASAITGPQTAGITRVSGLNYQVGTSDGDRQIVLTTGGATATAGQLEAQIYYTMD